MTAVLRIRLLGSFEIQSEDGPAPALAGARRRELLAYLLLNPGPTSRQRIAYLFWPDSSDAQARTNLRQLLHHLRSALPDPDRFLVSGEGRVAWKSDAPAAVDIHEIERAWLEAEGAAARSDTASERSALERAAGLYRGHLLPECYERWIEPHRRRLRARALEAGTRLARLLEEGRDYLEALRRLEDLRAFDPLREETSRALMRLHALRGEAPLGLAVYRELTERLERELGVAPSEETRTLAERLVSRGDSSEPTLEGPPLAATHPAPFVGRHREWKILLDRWRSASRRPSLVLLSGEAGIGKTRLAEELLGWADRQGIGTARARCYAAEGSLAFDAVAQWLRTPALFAGLGDLDRHWIAETSRLLPELRSRPAVKAGAKRGYESWRRPRLFEALRRAVTASGEPRILLLDDLQWCDRDTLDWIHYILRRGVGPPLMVLATLRTGELDAGSPTGTWLLDLAGEGHLREIALERLDRDATRELGEALTGKAFSEDEANRFFGRTEGNPLFAVETLRASFPDGGEGRAGKAFLPAGAHALPIPVRIRSVIASRVERLTPVARRILELSAAVGREFDLDVLRMSAPENEARLVDALDELCRRHLVRDHGDRTYDFAHDRIREVTWAGVSTARRSWLHRRIAEALESREGSVGGAGAREIAGHFDSAGLPARAIPRYRDAAERAVLVYASEEAVSDLNRALELLETIPPSRERDGRELELRMALGPPLVALEFYSGTRVWENYERARELTRRLGRPPAGPVLRGLALAHLMGSRLGRTLELADKLRAAAEREGDRMLQMEAHYVLGVARYWCGDFRRSREHLEHACSLYAPERTRDHLRLYSQDPGVVCHVRLGLTLWHLGESEEAQRTVADAISRAEELGHPFTLAYARYFAGWVLLQSDDLDELGRQAAALVRESASEGLRLWPLVGEFLLAWVEVRRHGDRNGLDRMVVAADGMEEQGMNLGFPFFQSLIARGWGLVDSPRVGLGHLDMALAMSRETGERFWDAELHRVRGALLAQLGEDPERSTASFRRAVEIASAQECRPLLKRALAHLDPGWNGSSAR